MNKNIVLWCLVVVLLGMSLLVCSEGGIATQKRTALICPLSHSEMVPSPVLHPEIQVDNVTPLDELLTTSYTLEELYDFFGEICLYEQVHPKGGRHFFTFTEVNNRFPVECLRKSETESTASVQYGALYTVYKVTEGGYFYVMWLQAYRHLFDECSERLSSYYTAYVSELPKKEHFALIIPGISTAADVARIDSALAISHSFATIMPSCTLLSDGSVMEVHYEWKSSDLEDDERTRENLIVIEKELLPPGDPGPTLSLICILPKDLP